MRCVKIVTKNIYLLIVPNTVYVNLIHVFLKYFRIFYQSLLVNSTINLKLVYLFCILNKCQKTKTIKNQCMCLIKTIVIYENWISKKVVAKDTLYRWTPYTQLDYVVKNTMSCDMNNITLLADNIIIYYPWTTLCKCE